MCKFFIFFLAVMLAGCIDDTPVFVDCGNGYMVRPPLACPVDDVKF